MKTAVILMLFLAVQCFLGACNKKETQTFPTNPQVTPFAYSNTTATQSALTTPDKAVDFKETPSVEEIKYVLPSEDLLGNLYLPLEMIDILPPIDWSLDDYSDPYLLNDYKSIFLPQARDRKLVLQDLCARYVPEYDEEIQHQLERLTLEQLHDQVLAMEGPYKKENLALIKKYMDKQNNIRALGINETYSWKNGNDLLGVLSITKEKGEMISYNIGYEVQVQFYKFQISIDNMVIKEVEYEDALFYILELDTKSVLIIQPAGYNKEAGDEYGYTYGHNAQVFTITELIQAQFKGYINGTPDLIMEGDRFTTIGYSDTAPNNYGPTYEVVREYCIYDEQLFTVKHQWDFSRTVWKVRVDLPLYANDKKTVGDIIPAGTMIMVTAYTYDGWLCVVSNQISGYIKMTLDSDGYWDPGPRALPGGEHMEDYFVEYGPVAG